MSNDGGRTISITQDDVEEVLKLEDMLKARVSLLREPRKITDR